jgi:hypothetical protein
MDGHIPGLEVLQSPTVADVQGNERERKIRGAVSAPANVLGKRRKARLELRLPCLKLA